MNDRERIGKRVAAARKAKGYTQTELAELAGIDRGSLAKVEAGKYFSTGIDVLARICKPLGLRVELVDIEDEGENRSGEHV